MTHDETTAAVRRGLLTEDAREVYKRPGGTGPHTCPRCGRTAHGVAPTAEGCPGCTLPEAELAKLRGVAEDLEFVEANIGQDKMEAWNALDRARDTLRAVLGNRA